MKFITELFHSVLISLLLEKLFCSSLTDQLTNKFDPKLRIFDYSSKRYLNLINKEKTSQILEKLDTLSKGLNKALINLTTKQRDMLFICSP